MKLAKLPDWYGIEGIKFIYYNEWADPEIVYKGKLLNSHDVEDTAWKEFISLGGETFEDFEKYMKDNAEHIKELCEEVLHK